MGGVCPFCPSKPRVSPETAEVEDSSRVMVRFNDIPAVTIGPVLDVAIQTDTFDQSRWAQDSSSPPAVLVHHDSSFVNQAYLDDERNLAENDEIHVNRPYIYHKQFTRKEYEEELEMSKFREQMNEFNVTLGIFFDGAYFMKAVDNYTEPLLELFNNVQLFDWKNSEFNNEVDLRKRAAGCDCFLVFVRGGWLLEKTTQNFHPFMPNGNSENRKSPFYGKPASIACDDTDVLLVKELRNFLSSMGVVVLPSILTSPYKLNENKAMSELKYYATALKLVTNATVI